MPSARRSFPPFQNWCRRRRYGTRREARQARWVAACCFRCCRSGAPRRWVSSVRAFMSARLDRFGLRAISIKPDDANRWPDGRGAPALRGQLAGSARWGRTGRAREGAESGTVTRLEAAVGVARCRFGAGAVSRSWTSFVHGAWMLLWRGCLRTHFSCGAAAHFFLTGWKEWPRVPPDFALGWSGFFPICVLWRHFGHSFRPIGMEKTRVLAGARAFLCR